MASTACTSEQLQYLDEAVGKLGTATISPEGLAVLSAALSLYQSSRGAQGAWAALRRLYFTVEDVIRDHSKT